MDATQLAHQAGVAILLVGLAVAGYADWKRREVSDAVWVILAVAGLATGAVALVSVGWVAMAIWTLVALFVLEHMVPWDERLSAREWLPGVVEMVLYASVGVVLLGVGLRSGFRPAGDPPAAVAVYLSVLFARALFEARVLYGGADAKALMVAALLVPIFPHPLLPLPTPATEPLGIFPFAFTMLLNAAILAVAVPLYLVLRNARRGELQGLRSFTGLWIDVRELPDRFVWIRDPTFHSDPEEEEVETSDDDRKLRERQRDRLIASGTRRVWVTPQIPFVTLMAAGALVGILAGSLAFDLFAGL